MFLKRFSLGYLKIQSAVIIAIYTLFLIIGLCFIPFTIFISPILDGKISDFISHLVSNVLRWCAAFYVNTIGNIIFVSVSLITIFIVNVIYKLKTKNVIYDSKYFKLLAIWSVVLIAIVAFYNALSVGMLYGG